MAHNADAIRKEISRLRNEMEGLRRRLEKLELELVHQSVKEVRGELGTEYPGMKFDDDLLTLVGIIPSNPPEMDKEIIREAIRKVME